MDLVDYGCLDLIPDFNKDKPKDVSISPVGLGSTRIWTFYAPKSPQTLVALLNF